MMDGSAMYPDGFHPIAMNQTPDCCRIAEYKSRMDAGLKHYFVNFGILARVTSRMMMTETQLVGYRWPGQGVC